MAQKGGPCYRGRQLLDKRSLSSCCKSLSQGTIVPDRKSFSRPARALPTRQWLSLWEQRRRPPPAAETGRSCWGRGQQDASEALRMLGAATRAVSPKVTERARTLTEKHRHSDSIALTKSLPIAVCRLCRAGLALSGASRQLSQRESPWQAGFGRAGRLRRNMAQKGGPCAQT